MHFQTFRFWIHATVAQTGLGTPEDPKHSVFAFMQRCSDRTRNTVFFLPGGGLGVWGGGLKKAHPSEKKHSLLTF